MLHDDSKEAVVRTINDSIYPKGTTGRVIDCHFIANTSARVYLFQTQNHIAGMVYGAKTAWYLDRDLENV